MRLGEASQESRLVGNQVIALSHAFNKEIIKGFGRAFKGYKVDLYNRMKERGIDMSWYEKGKKGRAQAEAPLEDEECYPGSIYYIQGDGSLWTIDAHGKPYKKIRQAGELTESATYLCACCDGRWQDVLDKKEKKVIHP